MTSSARPSRMETHAGARVARLAVGAEVRAVDRLGQDPRGGGLAGPARPDEEVGVRQPVAGDRVAQGRDDRVLADELAEALGAEAPIQGAVCWRGGGVGGGVGHRLGWGHAGPTVHRLGSWPTRLGREIGRAPGVDPHQLALTHEPGSSQVVPRHPKAIAYRCFLPDLTGFTDQRCAGPDSQRRARWWWANGADLDREFSSAIADCGYRAPLVPRLARPAAMVGQGSVSVNRDGRWRRGWDSNPRRVAPNGISSAAP